MDYYCPSCLSEDYTIDNYWDDFDDEGGAMFWDCTCNKCKFKFTITRAYECTSITIEPREE